MLSRRLFLASLAAVALAPAGHADQPMIRAEDGAAIGGYDAVAYFTQGRPVRGMPDEAVIWLGAEWRFANARNRERFEANPRAYAPKYGGYCAYAMAKGYAAPGDPEAWRIEEGQLYLNYSPDVRDLWAQDMAVNIARADAHWPQALQE